VTGERLAGVLLNAGLVRKQQLAEALRVQARTGSMLGEILVSLGYITEEELADTLAAELGFMRGLPEVPSAGADALAAVDADLARRQRVLPLARRGNEVIVGTPDPTDVAALDAARRALGASKLVVSVLTDTEFKAALATRTELPDALPERPEQPAADQVGESAASAFGDDRLGLKGPAVSLVDELLRRAVGLRASDVHIEPQDGQSLVRMRVDGVLQNVATLPKSAHPMIVSRVKVLSELDIANRHTPQDGHYHIEADHGKIDLRVSVLPVVGGEKVVIRLLNPEENVLGVDELGIAGRTLSGLRQLLDRPQGMLIVTGPTGSGKSTTLYAAMEYIKRRTLNITTIEDPVERNIDGLNQVQVHPKRGLVFASGLRAILRQDPDVIMIGETRDLETAETAFRAALTGHLVVTTLHTNDAAQAVTRLMEIGLAPYLVASCLIGVLGQRLVRVVCSQCGAWREIHGMERRRLGEMAPERPLPEREQVGEGCPACHDTGYHGRTAIVELLEVDGAISPLVTRGADAEEIRRVAVASGMETMQEAGLAKIAHGETCAAEVLRVVPPATSPGTGTHLRAASRV
jgi:type IV pilus assembly protein PilB